MGKRGPARQSLATRFWSRVDRRGGDECWPWLGAFYVDGYGTIGRGGRNCGMLRAHRVSWEMAHGPVPDGLCVCHHCDNRGCVNPAHLFVGTKRDNTWDMIRKGRSRLSGPHYGEDHGRAKLTEVAVRDARRRFTAGGVTKAELAREYGVSSTAMGDALSGRHWACISEG